MYTLFLRTLLIAGITFPALMMIGVALLALSLGSLPNSVQIQPATDLAFLQILWRDNPWETIKLVLVDKPLVTVENSDPVTGLQVWGSFYYAGTLFVYLLASIFTAMNWKTLLNSSINQRVLFAAGIALMLIGVTYLRRTECCTSGHAWVLDTWLLARVYTPDMGTVNWLELYEHMRPWLPALQTATLVAGMTILYWWYLSRGKSISWPGVWNSYKSVRTLNKERTSSGYHTSDS
jgi:hypothetical protein